MIELEFYKELEILLYKYDAEIVAGPGGEVVVRNGRMEKRFAQLDGVTLNIFQSIEAFVNEDSIRSDSTGDNQGTGDSHHLHSAQEGDDPATTADRNQGH